MSGRPRRTRIYGANYNIGESYYKPTLDNLDRKHFPSSSTPLEGMLRKPIADLDIDLPQPKVSFKRALTEEPTLFDYHGRETRLNSAPFIDDDLDEDVQATLRKIREVKRAGSHFLEDSHAALEDTSSARRTGSRFLKSLHTESDDLDFPKISLPSLNHSSDAFQSSTSAMLRAGATKERLANIESEMSERFEKQVQREQRSANLKKLLVETGIESSSKSAKKVTF